MSQTDSALDRIAVERFIDAAQESTLTDRQAEVLYRFRRGQSRKRVADELDTSRSNVDNIRRHAEQKVQRADQTCRIVERIGSDAVEY